MKKFAVSFCFTLAFVFAYLPQTAYAASELPDQIYNVFLAGRAIAIVLAVVGIAGIALTFFTGNERKLEKAKAGILAAGIALAIIILLPTVFSSVKSFAQTDGGAWDPDAGNRTPGQLMIVQPDDYGEWGLTITDDGNQDPEGGD